ncbi:MAG: DinB family protein [Synergistaceae bacterium]|jgi:hypothetical protein|nr:DinB family protein [Synergistaceae bacterium]
MSIASNLRANCDRGFDFLFKQIDEATDDVWTSKAGKWYYWQHIYHTFVCVDICLLPAGQNPDPGPGKTEWAFFKETPSETLSKETVRAYGKVQRDRANRWLDGLSDEAMSAQHEGWSARKSAEITNLMAVSNLVTHIFYHIGCCDTTLREHNHPGVY